jgi:hypothetical protein
MTHPFAETTITNYQQARFRNDSVHNHYDNLRSLLEKMKTPHLFARPDISEDEKKIKWITDFDGEMVKLESLTLEEQQEIKRKLGEQLIAICNRARSYNASSDSLEKDYAHFIAAIHPSIKENNIRFSRQNSEAVLINWGLIPKNSEQKDGYEWEIPWMPERFPVPQMEETEMVSPSDLQTCAQSDSSVVTQSSDSSVFFQPETESCPPIVRNDNGEEIIEIIDEEEYAVIWWHRRDYWAGIILLLILLLLLLRFAGCFSPVEVVPLSAAGHADGGYSATGLPDGGSGVGSGSGMNGGASGGDSGVGSGSGMGGTAPGGGIGSPAGVSGAGLSGDGAAGAAIDKALWFDIPAGSEFTARSNSEGLWQLSSRNDGQSSILAEKRGESFNLEKAHTLSNKALELNFTDEQNGETEKWIFRIQKGE